MVMVQISRLVKCAAFGGLLAILAPLAAPGSARAHVIDVFDLTGAFDNGSALSGTVTIDITTGQATAIDAVADGFGINEIDTQFPEVLDMLSAPLLAATTQLTSSLRSRTST
jgi:hypothetical protein